MEAEEYERLREDAEVAYFGAELYEAFPESCGIEDARRIVRAMDRAEEAADEAMRKDFAGLSPAEQEKMLSLLSMCGVQDASWWERILRA